MEHGIAAPPEEPLPGVLSRDSDAAVLVRGGAGDRREAFWLLEAGECEDRFFGGPSAEAKRTRIFPLEGTSEFEIRVKPLWPITLSYTFYISDVRCEVAATTLFAPGRKYVVIGARQYSEGFLPSATGCQIEIEDAETKEKVPLIPALIKPGRQQCKLK